MQVVVLSSSRLRSKYIGDAARSEGRMIMLASSLDELRMFRKGKFECVLLVDLEHCAGSVSSVLNEASRLGAPTLVISSDFHSSQWMTLFKQGVCDVLRDPVSPVELNRSIEAAARSIPPATLESAGRWYSRAWRWGRSLLRL